MRSMPLINTGAIYSVFLVDVRTKIRSAYSPRLRVQRNSAIYVPRSVFAASVGLVHLILRSNQVDAVPI